MPEVVEVSRYQFSIAYTGDERGADHSISVEALAPALLAFGKLMREANAELNGPKTRANVYVVSDFEHKCFNINFDLALSFYEQVKSFVQASEAKDAKEILEWIGIIGSASTVPLSFLGYLRWKKGRKTTLTDKGPSGNVVVSVEGEGASVTINQHIYNMSQNVNALKATRDAFLPIGQDGFEKVEVRQAESVVTIIDPIQIKDIVASCTTALAETKEKKPEVEITTAWLSVYSPVYDEKAENWRFRLGTEIIYADISETSISHDALERGGALTDDTYQVKLEITVVVDENGNRSKAHYKVLEVIRFVPAAPRMRQTSFLPRPPDGEGNEPSA